MLKHDTNQHTRPRDLSLYARTLIACGFSTNCRFLLNSCLLSFIMSSFLQRVRSTLSMATESWREVLEEEGGGGGGGRDRHFNLQSMSFNTFTKCGVCVCKLKFRNRTLRQDSLPLPSLSCQCVCGCLIHVSPRTTDTTMRGSLGQCARFSKAAAGLRQLVSKL